MSKPQINLEEYQKEVSEKLAAHGRDIDWMKYLTIGVSVILFAAFLASIMAIGAIYFQYLASKQSSYEDLTDKINQQSYKIDYLNHQLELQNQVKSTQPTK